MEGGREKGGKEGEGEEREGEGMAKGEEKKKVEREKEEEEGGRENKAREGINSKHHLLHFTPPRRYLVPHPPPSPLTLPEEVSHLVPSSTLQNLPTLVIALCL